MFKYEKEYYEVRDEEDKAYYKMMFSQVFGIFSPLDLDENLDFPNKEELGGIAFRFIGGSAAYFKVQREMPDKTEVNLILEGCRFLRDSFGEYVVAYILCEPHIEIRDIEVSDEDNIDITFVSSRKNDGDKILKGLIKKLQKNKKFTREDFVLKFVVPFIGRKNDAKFQNNFLKLIKLYEKEDLDLPDDLIKSNVRINRIY